MKYFQFRNSIYFFQLLVIIWYQFDTHTHKAYIIFFSFKMKKVLLYRVTRDHNNWIMKIECYYFFSSLVSKIKYQGLKSLWSWVNLVRQDRRKFHRQIEMKQILRLLTTETKWVIQADWDKPPEIRPPSGTWVATPNPPSLTGAEFSLLASNTQWGLRSLWMMSLAWQYLKASRICLR